MLSLCSKEEFDYLQRGLMVRFGHCARVALWLKLKCFDGTLLFVSTRSGNCLWLFMYKRQK